MFLHYLKKNVLDMCIFDKIRQKVTETVMWKILEEYKYLDKKNIQFLYNYFNSF